MSASDADVHPLAEPVRAHGWAIHLLLLAAAALILPDLFDAGVFKTATLALMASLVLVPFIAFAARDAAGSWFTSAGARLYVLSIAIGLVGAFSSMDHGTVVDRLLLFGLANVAAIVGGLTAERAPRLLGCAIGIATLVAALSAWAQALGWEATLTPGPEEIVALSGNSTRAGALLALGTAALIAVQAAGLRPSAAGADAADRSAADGARDRRRHLGRGLMLAVVAGALVLTRARGARYALLAGVVALIAVAWIVARANRDPTARHDSGAGEPLLMGMLTRIALPIVVAVGLAGLVGGVDALAGRKLEGSASILSGQDLTTNVRLALWESTIDMTADRPLLGHGLGRFRAAFPPYRDPVEAALPGLGGAATEAHHPHNEVLLAFAESGVLGGALFAIFLLASVIRGLRRALAQPGPPTWVALAVLVAGVVVALAQDALTDPATALPVFAAIGFVWAPTPRETRAWIQHGRVLAGFALAFGVGILLLAWPRLDAHLSLRSFYLRATESGVITPEAFDTLLYAADAGPGDIDVQRIALKYATDYAPVAPDPATKVRAIQAVEKARARLKRLVPDDR